MLKSSITHVYIKLHIHLQGLFLVIGSMLQNPCDFSVVKHAVLDWCLPVHFIYFVIREPITHRCKKLPEFILMDQSHILLVEAAKSILDGLLGIRPLKSFSKEGEKHGEVDWAWCLTHHRFQVFVCWILAQRCKHVMKILIVYESIPVVINHVECLFELLNLVLIEHGEHIAGGSLGSFLGGSPPACGLAGRHALISCRSESSNK